MPEQWGLQDAEAAVVEAALAFLRWAHQQADLCALPAPALMLLDATEALGRAYDPHA